MKCPNPRHMPQLTKRKSGSKHFRCIHYLTNQQKKNKNKTQLHTIMVPWYDWKLNCPVLGCSWTTSLFFFFLSRPYPHTSDEKKIIKKKTSKEPPQCLDFTLEGPKTSQSNPSITLAFILWTLSHVHALRVLENSIQLPK